LGQLTAYFGGDRGSKKHVVLCWSTCVLLQWLSPRQSRVTWDDDLSALSSSSQSGRPFPQLLDRPSDTSRAIIPAIGSARFHSYSSNAASTWLLFVWRLRREETEGAWRLALPDVVCRKDPRLQSQLS